MKEEMTRRLIGAAEGPSFARCDGETVTLRGTFKMIELRDAMLNTQIRYTCAKHAPAQGCVRMACEVCARPADHQEMTLLPAWDPLEEVATRLVETWDRGIRDEVLENAVADLREALGI